MDLLQESSSIWDEFLRRPWPQEDLLSFWPRHPWHLLSHDTLCTFCPNTPLAPFVSWHLWYSTLQHGTVTYCTVLWFPYFERVHGNLKKLRTEMRMTTVLLSNVPFCTVLYCTILYTVTSLADTHLLIKLFMLGPLDKKFYGGWWWVVALQL